MKIAYISFCDVSQYNNRWSGIVYYISQALKNQGMQVDNIILKERFLFFLHFKRRIYKYLFSKNYLVDRDLFAAKLYGREIRKKLLKLNPDIVLCSAAAMPLAYLKTDKPVFFLGDAPFAGLIDFYSTHTNLCKESIIKGNLIEKRALKNCNLIIYSSDWAAEGAIKKYNLDPSKVKVVTLGANIECNRSMEDIKKIVDLRLSDKCKLLFLGVDWFRKGGNIALEVAKQLNKMGLNTELAVVGCNPVVKGQLPSFVKTFGYLDKSIAEESKELDKIFLESHFMILPTRAECAAMVLAEANSFGVPSISTYVGGVPTVIKNGLNGRLFSKDAKIEEYCEYIMDLFSNYSKYKKLALSSFNEYKSRLNWDVAGKKVKKLIEELIATE